jgi:hypothetical protein
MLNIQTKASNPYNDFGIRWFSVYQTEKCCEVLIVMNSDLEKRKEFIVRYFIEKGLKPSIIYKFIQCLAHTIFFSPGISAFEIKEELLKTKLPFVDLEEEILLQVKKCLIIEGRKGLEYRFGKGFSYLSHQDRQVN